MDGQRTLSDGGIAQQQEAGFDQLQALSDRGFGTDMFSASLLEVAYTALIGVVRSLGYMV